MAQNIHSGRSHWLLRWQPRLWQRWLQGGHKMATVVVGALRLQWDWLCSEHFWMPQNVSWADLEGPGDSYSYLQAHHILSVFPLVVDIFSVRLLFK